MKHDGPVDICSRILAEKIAAKILGETTEDAFQVEVGDPEFSQIVSRIKGQQETSGYGVIRCEHGRYLARVQKAGGRVIMHVLWDQDYS